MLAPTSAIPVDTWRHCYDSGWNGLIVPESYSHPAKFSRTLIQRIYQHCSEEGWLKPGATVLDPFGGVGLGACDALQQGLRWLGVELEPRFVALANGFACDGSIAEVLRGTFHPAQPATLEYFVSDGVQQWGPGGLYTSGDAGFASHAEAQAWIAAQPTIAYTGLLILKVGDTARPATLDFAWQTVTPAACGRKDAHEAHHVTGNLELWARRYGHLPQYVAPTLMQGDSRVLGTVLREQVTACVSSPPFQQSHMEHHWSDAYREQFLRENEKRYGINKHRSTLTNRVTTRDSAAYGTSPGQLGALPPGSLDAAISSPPFSSVMPSNAAATWHQKRESIGEQNSLGRSPTYGTSPAQLGNLPAGTVEAAISSPPWEDGHAQMGKGMSPDAIEQWAQREAEGYANGTIKGHGSSAEVNKKRLERQKDGYGTSPNQLGTEHGTTFWEAAAQIVQQVFDLLKLNGIAVWVVKSYVRDGQIVDFPGDWRRLCASVGFRTLHEHHALLVEDHGTQGGLFGEDTAHTTHRKSFFRRLHEKKRPDLAINYEVVLCMQKQAGMDAGRVAVCLSSPPYASTPIAACEGNIAGGPGGRKASALTDVNGNIKDIGYGHTEGQLGSMPAGLAPQAAATEEA